MGHPAAAEWPHPVGLYGQQSIDNERPLYTQNHGAKRNYPGGYRHDSVPDARTRELSWPSARVTYLSGYYASGPRERSMRIVTESTSDRLTKPDALRIQPGWQNVETFTPWPMLFANPLSSWRRMARLYTRTGR